MPTVSSQNYTSLYGAGGTVTPGTAYGNANVVGLLSAGSDGANTVGNIDANGTITAAAVSASGNVAAAIVNATTVNAATLNGNLAGGTVAASTISATGNIVTDGYFVGNFAGNITGNIAVTGSNTQVLFNNAGNVGASADFTFNDATNVLSVAGNVSAGYYVGNGSLLTGVATSLPSATTDQYLRYNGSAWAAATLQLDNDPSPDLGGDMGGNNYNIANVGNIQVNGTYTGSGAGISNINGANVNGTVSSANTAGTVIANAQGNITSVGVLTSLSVSGNVVGGNVSTAGNVAANYFLGNGALLTGIASSYGNAEVAAYLPTYTGAMTAMTGNITTTGNITGAYIFGNGSQLTGLPATYGNADVAAYLPTYTGAMPALTGNVTTTANVQGAYLIGDGSFITNLPGGSYGNANVAAYLPTFTGNLAGGNLSVTGIARVGVVLGTPGSAITVAGKDISDVTTAYFSADGPTGNATIQSYPGTGAVVQQWNFDTTGNITLPGPASSGSNVAAIVAGNAVLQMDNVSGNITAGNIVVNASQINTVAQQGVVIPTSAISNARIVIGNGWQGNTSTTYDGVLAGRIRNTRAAVWDYGTTGNSATQSELAVLSSLEITSNVANAFSRINAASVTLQIGGGSAANVVSTNNSLAIVAAQNTLSIGTNGSATVGNTTIAQPIATGSLITAAAGGNATSAVAHQSSLISTGGTIANAVMYSAQTIRTTGSAVATNTAVYYVPPVVGNSLVGGSIGTGFRTATTYYGLRVDDDLAQAKLGSLRQYHEFEYQIPTTTGNVAIDKANGQVQVLSPTGNITITDYTNFVNNAYVDGTTAEPWQADTVTIIVNQGTTGGFNITLPTSNVTNGQTFYANGIKTVSNVANSVTLISVTASRIYASGTAPSGRSDVAYLTTVSPEFTVA